MGASRLNFLLCNGVAPPITWFPPPTIALQLKSKGSWFKLCWALGLGLGPNFVMRLPVIIRLKDGKMQ